MATGELAYRAGLSNISDGAAKLNQILAGYGLAVIAERPTPPLQDRWGNDSQQHIWRLTILRQ